MRGLALVVCFVSAWPLAAPAGAAPASQPTTQPDPRRVDALVAQLGDDDAKARARAQLTS